MFSWSKLRFFVFVLFFKRMWPTKTVATTLKSRFFCQLAERRWLSSPDQGSTYLLCLRTTSENAPPCSRDFKMKKEQKKNRTWSICGKCLSIMKVLHSARTRTGGWTFHSSVSAAITKHTTRGLGRQRGCLFPPWGRKHFSLRRGRNQESARTKTHCTVTYFIVLFLEGNWKKEKIKRFLLSKSIL